MIFWRVNPTTLRVLESPTRFNLASQKASKPYKAPETPVKNVTCRVPLMSTLGWQLVIADVSPGSSEAIWRLLAVIRRSLWLETNIRADAKVREVKRQENI